jgi:hypothetical protein
LSEARPLTIQPPPEMQDLQKKALLPAEAPENFTIRIVKKKNV